MNRIFFRVAAAVIASTCLYPAVSSFASQQSTGTSSMYFDTKNNFGWLKPIITLSGGVATTKVGRKQTLTIPNDLSTYSYSPNGAYSSQPMWGAFAGTVLEIRPCLAATFGLGYYQPSSFSTGNSVLIQGIDAPSLNQYQYNYNVKSQQLLAEGKLLLNVNERLHPYASAGFGMAINKAYGYTTNIPPFLTFTPMFAVNTTLAFTYSIGAGIDIDVQKNWRIGAGYRFSDLGKASFFSGSVDVVPFAPVLSQQHLYAHEVMAQLSYLFT